MNRWRYIVRRRFAAPPKDHEQLYASLAAAKRVALRRASVTGREHFVGEGSGPNPVPIYAVRRIHGRLVTENLITGSFGYARVRP